MADVFSRYERCYPLIQSAYDTIPSPTNSDCCLVTDCTAEAKQNEIERSDKTGTLDRMPAQGGRRVGSVSVAMTAAGNGTAGTAPDCKNLITAAMGAAPTIVASTSVTWALGDALSYMAIWKFLTGLANATSKCAFNSLMQKMEAAFGSDEPTLTFSGESGWVIDNDQLADGTTPAAAKGGLAAWPSQPASPVVNGIAPPGFKVAATIDGTAYDNIISGKVALAVQRELKKIGNSEFPTAGAPGDRVVTVDWSMIDNDSAALRTLKQKAHSRTPINMSYTVGTLAGNRWVYTLTNVIVPKPTEGTNGTFRTVNFAGAIAYASAMGLKDQYTLAIN
jgi:hypothetical protein